MEFEFLYFLSNFKLDTSFTVQRFAVRDLQQFKVEFFFCMSYSYVKLAKKVWKKFNATKKKCSESNNILFQVSNSDRTFEIRSDSYTTRRLMKSYDLDVIETFCLPIVRYLCCKKR